MLDNAPLQAYPEVMSRLRKKSRRSTPQPSVSAPLGEDSRRTRHIEIMLLVLLLGLGVYQSVIYFGHQVVPNSDFPGFVKTGRQLLSFQLPSDYKRAPVVGILQTLLSGVVGGQHGDLTGGWLLNALLHPFSIVLVYLVGRMIVGRGAFWLALIVAINPYVLQLVCEPIAETVLLFFVLITFFFIFRRSSWAYLFACLASMVRYEGAALILTAFVMDMIQRKTMRLRLRALSYSVLASVPLGLWMLGTALQKKPLADTHYLNVLSLGPQTWASFSKFMRFLWETTFRHLWLTPAAFKGEPNEVIFTLSRILAVVSFLFGSVYGLVRRQGNILALLLFFTPYLAIHSLMPEQFVYHRFCTTVYWMVLLICLFGLQGCWRLIKGDNRIPAVVVVGLQVVVAVVALIWFVQLLGWPAKIADYSRDSAYLAYVAIGLIAVAGGLSVWRDKLRSLTGHGAVALLLGVMVLSNQFYVAMVVGNGDRDIEFKRLADWFHENGRDGEKLVTTMPGHLHTYAPAQRRQVMGTDVIKAADRQEFVERCREKGVVYVAWDSRLGLARGDRYYTIFGLQNIAMLAQQRDYGPYQFVKRIDGNDPRRFINIFRLRQPRRLGTE